MSRVRGQLAFGDPSFPSKNVACTILSELVVLDLWTLLRIRRALISSLKLLRPLLESIFLMCLGAGLLFVYTLNELGTKDGSHDGNSRSIEQSVPRLDDQSAVRTQLLEKEILSLKLKTLSLDATLRRMDTRLKSLQDIEKPKDEELADFAAESVGGSIVSTPDTESFYESKDCRVTLFGIPIWRPDYFTPRKVIQPWTQAGECWAFRGSRGKIEIELPYAVTLSHVTMEHIPISLSITGVIDSAPREFLVLGKFRDIYLSVQKFVYNVGGPPSQIFRIENEELSNVPFKRIMLEVRSNWGHPAYTCIYRFKVHGKLFDPSNVQIRGTKETRINGITMREDSSIF